MVAVIETGNDGFGAALFASEDVGFLQQLAAGGERLNGPLPEGSLEDREEGFVVERLHYLQRVICCGGVQEKIVDANTPPSVVLLQVI